VNKIGGSLHKFIRDIIFLKMYNLMYERQDKNENRKNTVILFSFFTVLTIIINIVSQAIFIKYYAGLFNIQL
jgi:hypothetical protein